MNEKQNKMKVYEIEVCAVGYESYFTAVTVSSLAETRQYERAAKLEWCALNDISPASIGLAFVKTHFIKTVPPIE